MRLHNSPTTYVFYQYKDNNFWRKYDGKKVKPGTIFRYSRGYGWIYDTAAKHNTY